VKRVLVIGSGGSGKSTLAARIGARTGLPVVHLDRLHWSAGWVATPAEEWTRTVGEIAAREAWVMDGNYGGTLELRLAACDLVVFLDVPRLRCLWRVVWRRLRHRGHARPDMAPGCAERLDMEFIRWVWTYPRRRRPGVLAKVDAAGKPLVVLRSTAEIERFVASLGHTPF
jgi:adenylate kinase family enzyme